jgi:hypothetical protein
MNKSSVVTVYKVVTPDLKSGCSPLPNFPRELVVQYSADTWVTGVANSKLFCFMDLDRARSYRDKQISVSGPLDIWEAKAVGVSPKTRRLKINCNLMSRFTNFWSNLIPWNHRGVRKTNQYFVADKIILVKRIDNSPCD